MLEMSIALLLNIKCLHAPMYSPYCMLLNVCMLQCIVHSPCWSMAATYNAMKTTMPTCWFYTQHPPLFSFFRLSLQSTSVHFLWSPQTPLCWSPQTPIHERRRLAQANNSNNTKMETHQKQKESEISFWFTPIPFLTPTMLAFDWNCW